ncbi:MAG: hypothetical protein IJ563_10545 [Selenomonadaceae bacterium]|nr:hypothetical protein [Selenomonadaceae bacterium]
MTNILTLTDEFFIGAGGHQATYIHPIDQSKCIKIPHTPDDGDVKKELRYRRICQKKLENSKLVTKYYGYVDTNMGLGYVFERVLDLDGQTSKDLKDFLPTDEPSSEQLKIIHKLLLDFKEDFLREKIAIVDTDITNFMVQHIAPDTYQMRIVDNIGTPVAIPLVYYFDFAASWKCKRYWNYLADWLHRHYPKVVTDEFLDELRT